MTSGFGPSYDSYIFWSREKEIGDTYTYTRIKIWWSVFFSCAEFCWHLMISINADWCGASKIPASFLLFLRAFEWRMNIWIFFFLQFFSKGFFLISFRHFENEVRVEFSLSLSITGWETENEKKGKRKTEKERKPMIRPGEVFGGGRPWHHSSINIE